MEFIKKISNSNCYLSYFLFGTSIYLYLNKITFESVKKYIQNTTKDFYKNQNIYTDDFTDYSLSYELNQSEINYYHDKNYNENNNINDNHDDFNYFYYCYNQ
jgi:hypothetical protein